MKVGITESLATIIEEYFSKRRRKCAVKVLQWEEKTPGIITVSAPFELVDDCLEGTLMVAFNRVCSAYGVNVRFGGYICNQHGWAPCQSQTYNENAVLLQGELADELQHLCRVISGIYQ